MFVCKPVYTNNSLFFEKIVTVTMHKKWAETDAEKRRSIGNHELLLTKDVIDARETKVEFSGE